MDYGERVEDLILGGGEPGKYIAWELVHRDDERSWSSAP